MLLVRVHLCCRVVNEAVEHNVGNLLREGREKRGVELRLERRRVHAVKLLQSIFETEIESKQLLGLLT